ncbi:MAG: hypothetical protein IJU98_03605 [Synergistaceae bacterium]|nr:hypothetical protein [Synergistaceae bacterium]
MSRRLFSGTLLLVIAACAAWGLLPRLRLESGDRAVAILVDYREVVPLARGAGVSVEEALALLKERGARGMMVSELTGDDAAHGLGLAELTSVRDSTRIAILPGAPSAELLNEWIRIRLGESAKGSGPLTVPLPIHMLKNAGIVPDIEGLEAAKRAGFPVFYRPAPSLGWLAATASEMLRRVADLYPVAAFSPSGEIVSGYPDVSALAEVARERNLPVALVEFSRQLGAPALNNLASPLLLPLHSVTNEEMMARNITRKALQERLIRAAVERAVHLLLIRTAPQNMGNFTLADFADEVSDLAKGLEGHGFVMGWPKPLFAEGTWGFGLIPAWGLSLAFLLSLWLFASRMAPAFGRKGAGPAFAAGFLAASALLAFLIVKLPFAARWVGALTAPLLAAEASLIAMDLDKKISWRIGGGFLFALIGGLALAGFFSVPAYMLRLSSFSGVKLTLMLPPLLVILHDLKKRIHPESLTELLSRPPLWGELALCGVLLAGLGLMLFRSGNVSFIPGFEARVRETLERLLVARPRSKEVFLGYPSLLLLGFLVRNGLWARYREVLRVGVALGFSSVVNSFCHFHTPLALILLREFNGLWTGLLLGLVLIAAVRWVLLPLLRAARPLWE